VSQGAVCSVLQQLLGVSTPLTELLTVLFTVIFTALLTMLFTWLTRDAGQRSGAAGGR
jgi:hypothetical protein